MKINKYKTVPFSLSDTETRLEIRFDFSLTAMYQILGGAAIVFAIGLGVISAL